MSYPFKIQMNNSLRMANGWPMRSAEPVIEQRIFITADPAIPTYYTMENPVVLSGDFEISFSALTPGGIVGMVAGSSISNDNFIEINALNRIRFRAAGVDYATASVIIPSKYNNVIIKSEGGTLSITVNNVIELETLANPTFVVDQWARRFDGNYFNGIIANPTITDTSNPANSESWKLDQPHPINTEQSSSGNNLLTYVGATEATRELFTKDGDDWLGIERVVNGGFGDGLTGWSVINEDATHTVEIEAGGARYISGALSPNLIMRQSNLVIGDTYRQSTSVTNNNNAIKNVSLGGAAIPDGESVLVSASTGENTELTRTAVDTDVLIHDVSIKRILQAP